MFLKKKKKANLFSYVKIKTFSHGDVNFISITSFVGLSECLKMDNISFTYFHVERSKFKNTEHSKKEKDLGSKG